ncbi:cytochrome P450 3A27-like [Oncorhynchus kisutch]|uniref:cytochrome P450 3A27-like n=1 Tax=Oncorhynchus kisutch TaxID=8019 RepID=UPI0012DF3FD6|nr:cytochrome P450 3A27-like [Oncorhynchus kisutch]
MMSFLPYFSAETWTLLALLITLIVVYGYWPYGVFTKMGIPGPKPLPYFGTMLEYRKGFTNFDTECFQKYGRIWGIYDGRQPVLCTMDKSIIKTVLIKECYNIFTNRRNLRLNGEMFDSLFVAEDDTWRRIRSVLSPSFTSGRLKESRVDFLQLMIDSQKGNDTKTGEEQTKGLTDHEILSQAMIFIFAGYETSSSTMSFLAYNLANNPHVMTKLQEEIDTVFPNKALIQYEALMQMDYLDCVLNESLRLYPVAPRLERVAKKTVEINGIVIPKDCIVQVPTWTLHRDPEIWSDPEEFKPERFSKENKESIDPYTYMPFGAGPRNCIGMRFALIMIKLAMVEILQSFTFSVCDETEIPLEMDKQGLLMPKRPIKLRLDSRSNTLSNYTATSLTSPTT